MGRTATLCLFLALFASYGYFYQGGGWNQNSRFDLSWALVEDASPRIDTYHHNTGDKAQMGGHVYCDKAPGASMAAVPGVWLARLAAGALDVDGSSFQNPGRGLMWASYGATLCASALPLALALTLLAWMWGRGGGLVALAAGLGTPLWAYATLLWGHALCAAALLVAWLEFRRWEGNESVHPSGWLRGGLMGTAAGWATLTAYPAAIPAICLAVAVAALAWRRRARGVAGGFALGASTCALLLAGYNAWAFGSPLFLSYQAVQGFDGMRQGVMGVGLPSLSVLGEITFGLKRGLVWFAPIVLLAPVGAWVSLRHDGRSLATWLAAIFVVYYLLLNAGYHYWDGGWAHGPRHLAPAMVFGAVLVAPLFTRGRWWRAACVVLVCAGAIQSLAALSTTAQPPQHFGNPMVELTWPAFRQGDLALNRQDIWEAGTDAGALRTSLEPKAAWNHGQLMGLPGLWSLCPLLLFLACLWLGAWIVRRPRAARRPDAP